MGASHEFFIPAAILLENPGITIQEFSLLLNNIHYPLYSPSHIGDRPLLKTYQDANYFHMGVLGVANAILSLPFRDEKLNRSIGLKELEVSPRFNGSRWLNPFYRVIKKDGQVKGEAREIRIFPGLVLDVGKTISGWPEVEEEKPREYFFVNGEERVQEFEGKKKRRIEEVLRFEKPRKDIPAAQIVIAREVYQRFRVDEFRTLSALLEHFPQYAPYTLFDFSQDSGELYAGAPYKFPHDLKPGIKWLRKGDKYYLDIEDIFRRDFEDPYSSIILTAEAIKKKAWHCFYWCHGDEREPRDFRFQLDHPSSLKRRSREIYNWWLAKQAVRKNLTNTEWMRERLSTQGSVDFKGEREVMREIVEEFEENQRKALERERQRRADPKKESPF